MSARRALPPVAATALAVAAIALLYAAARAVSPGLGLGLYALANAVLFLDLIDLLVRLYARRANAAPPEPGGGSPSVVLDVGDPAPHRRRLHLRPWALVVSVHDAERDLPRFLDSLRPYRSRLWVIDDASTDRTVSRLRRAGIRCIEGGVNRRKPAALRALLGELPPEIETVVVFDPDVRFGAPEDVERVIYEHQRSGMAALAPRATCRQDGFLALLQGFEYELCGGIGRKSLGDLCTNPGVSVYDRAALAGALERHSLSVYAEDLEISVHLLAAGHRIYYDDRLVVETEGKRTLRSWFSQRVGWYYGLVRVYAECWPEIRRLARRSGLAAYQYLVYGGLLGVLLQPVRLASLALVGLSAAGGLGLLLGFELPGGRLTEPVYFVTAYLQYLLFSLLALGVGVPPGARRALAPAVPVYFFYALLAMVPAAVGLANWLGIRFAGRRLYRDHYQDEDSLRRRDRGRRRLAGAAR